MIASVSTELAGWFFGILATCSVVVPVFAALRRQWDRDEGIEGQCRRDRKAWEARR